MAAVQRTASCARWRRSWGFRYHAALLLLLLLAPLILLLFLPTNTAEQPGMPNQNSRTREEK